MSSDSNSQIGFNPFLRESELQPAASDHSETVSRVSDSATPLTPVQVEESIYSRHSDAISDVDEDIESVDVMETDDNYLSLTSKSVLARSHVLKHGKFTF